MILTRDRYLPNLAKLSLISFILFVVFLIMGAVRNSEHFYSISYLLFLLLLTAIPLFILSEKGISVGASFILVPTLLVSLDAFFLRMGLFNIYSYLDDTLFYLPSIEYIKKATLLVLLGNLSMWLGFFWPLSKKAGVRLGNKLHAWTSFYIRPKTHLIWIAFFIGICVRLYLIKKGIGGYFSEKSLRDAALPYIQLLLLLENLSTLSLIAYFCVQLKKQQGQKWGAFGLMLFVELITLVFIGFKGQILYRFFYLAVSYTFMKKKFSVKLVVTGIVLLIMITPINLMVRAQYKVGKIKAGETGNIQQGLISAGKELFSGSMAARSLTYGYETIMKNSATLEIFSMVLEYVDRNNIRFHGEDYLSLISWPIPRAIWPSKPKPHKGEWVRVEIYGRSEGSSIGQTVPGDFYMNFGSIGVIAGFFMLGFLQRSISLGLIQINSLRFVPIIPFIIFALAQPQSDLGPSFGGTIKILIFNIVILSIMFPKIKYRTSPPV